MVNEPFVLRPGKSTSILSQANAHNDRFDSRALIDLMQFVERLEERTKLVDGLFQRVNPLLRSPDNRVRETTIVTIGLIGK